MSPLLCRKITKLDVELLNCIQTILIPSRTNVVVKHCTMKLLHMHKWKLIKRPLISLNKYSDINIFHFISLTTGL